MDVRVGGADLHLAATAGGGAAAFLGVTEDEFSAYEALVLGKLRKAQQQQQRVGGGVSITNPF
jgi:hypothetical protein